MNVVVAVITPRRGILDRFRVETVYVLTDDQVLVRLYGYECLLIYLKNNNFIYTRTHSCVFFEIILLAFVCFFLPMRCSKFGTPLCEGKIGCEPSTLDEQHIWWTVAIR